MGRNMVIKFDDIKQGVVHSTLENWIEVLMFFMSWWEADSQK